MGWENQLIECDRKIAYPLSGSIIDCVSNGCRDSRYGDFAGPAGSNRIENRVRLADKMNIDVGYTGVSRAIRPRLGTNPIFESVQEVSKQFDFSRCFRGSDR